MFNRDYPEITANSPPEQLLTVSALNQCAQQLLEQSFEQTWVSGEICDLATPRSGHYYFTLKDAQAQVRCVMFKTYAQRLRFALANGQQLQVLAKVTLYAPRGAFQLQVLQTKPLGDGILQQAYLKLQRQLLATGIFADEKKQPIPGKITCIGVVTSATGAALQDILSVLARRSPLLRVIIYPCSVQGHRAAAEIERAILAANRRQECQALIVARGGGSLEDIWPFNEVPTIQAIAASTIPIITGIGHETDTTLCDLAADIRAATPSAAAEIISQDHTNLVHDLRQIQLRLQHSITKKLQAMRMQLQPLHQRLQAQAPQLKIQKHRLAVQTQRARLETCVQQLLQSYHLRLQHSLSALAVLNPLNTLQRGYAIISCDSPPEINNQKTKQKSNQRQVISSHHQVQAGDQIQVRLADGILKSTVTSSLPSTDKSIF